MILYHRTNQAAAKRIIQEGFRDGKGTYMTGRMFSGVWLSNIPLDASEGAIGDVLFKVDAKLPAKELRSWEWQEEGKPYREFLIPAKVLNAHVRKLAIIEGSLRDSKSTGRRGSPGLPMRLPKRRRPASARETV